MKIWEKVATEMTEQLKHEFKTKEAVKSGLYSLRTTPCELEREFRYIGSKPNKNCVFDCTECLDEYLEIEVREIDKQA